MLFLIDVWCWCWKCCRENHTQSSAVRECSQGRRLHVSPHCCFERLRKNRHGAYWDGEYNVCRRCRN